MNAINKNVRGLSALASLVGAKSGVKVVFDPHARTASTNGQTVYLPVFNILGGKKEAICISALVDHEIMHLKWTDFIHFKAFNSEMAHLHGENYGNFAGTMLNVIEDYWGEMAQARVYPGCRMNILAGVPILIELGFYCEYRYTPALLQAVSNFALHYLCAKCYALPELQIFTDSHAKALEVRIGNDYLQQLLSLLDEADSCTSTVSASDLTLRILNLVKKLASEIPEVEKEIENGSVPSPQDMADKLVDALNTLAGKPISNRDEMQEHVRINFEGDFSFDYKTSDPKQHCEAEDINVLSAKFNDKTPPLFGGFSAHEALVTSHPEAFRLLDDGLQDIRQHIRNGVVRSVSKLIEAKRLSESYFQNSGNRISSSRLANLASGNFNVFERTDEAEGIDTAVMLVSDFSGSMFQDGYIRDPEQGISQKFATYTNALVMEVGDVLARNEIPFAVTNFGTSVADFKTFSTPWKKVQAMIPCVSDMGTTATAEALHHALNALHSRAERKRVVVLVTDGSPNSGQATIAQMIEARHAGIHLVVLYLARRKTPFMEFLEQSELIECVLCEKPEGLCEAFAQAIKDSF